MKTPRLVLNEYGLVRKEKKLLNQIHFSLMTMEILSIIGPRGAGKGLFVKSLLGIHRGQLVGTAEKKGHQRFGLVSRTYPSIEHFTIFENLSLVSRLAGVEMQAHLAEEVEDVLKTVGLWSLIKNNLHESASQLNSFEKSLLNLARTLLLKPTILILDEPTLDMDPQQKAGYESIVEKLREVMSFIWINHDLEQVARMSDQVMFLKDGKMIECDSCELFFTKPKMQETEIFISGRIHA